MEQNNIEIIEIWNKLINDIFEFEYTDHTSESLKSAIQDRLPKKITVSLDNKNRVVQFFC